MVETIICRAKWSLGRRISRRYGIWYGAAAMGVGLWWVVLVFSCPAAGASTSDVSIEIGSGIAVAGGVAWVPIYIRPGAFAPATIDFQLEYDASRLHFAAIESGPAAQNAEKEVAAADSESGTVTVVIAGGLTTLDEGIAAYLYFDVVQGTPGDEVPLTPRAAAAADSWAHLLPVTMLPGNVVFVACEAPEAPANLTSRVLVTGSVRVQWAPAERAAKYVIYRSESASEASAVPIAMVRNATAYDDGDVDIQYDEERSLGCVPVAAPVAAHTPYYWVQAVNSCGESALSGPVSASVTSYLPSSSLRPAGSNPDGLALLFGFAVLLAAAWRHRLKHAPSSGILRLSR